MEFDEIRLPKNLANQLLVKTTIDDEKVEYYKILIEYKDNRYKFIFISDEELNSLYSDNIKSAKILHCYRKVQNGDLIMLFREPVKEEHCIRLKKAVISDDENYCLYINNQSIEDIEGDFDGDNVGVIGFSKEYLMYELDIPENKINDWLKPIRTKEDDFNEVVEIDINDKLYIDVKEEDEELIEFFIEEFKQISKLLNTEKDSVFLLKLFQKIGMVDFDFQIIKNFRSDNRLSDLLKILIVIPLIESGIPYEIKERLSITESHIEIAKILIAEYGLLEKYKGIYASRFLEAMIRTKYRGEGAKLTGKLQKQVNEIMPLIDFVVNKKGELEVYLNDELIKVLPKEYSKYHKFDTYKLLSKVYQIIVDLKRYEYPLEYLDIGMKLNKLSLGDRILQDDKFIDSLSEIFENRELMILCLLIYSLANKRKNITYHGIVNDVIDKKEIKNVRYEYRILQHIIDLSYKM